MLKCGDKVGIAACSNPLPDSGRETLDRLLERLCQMGLEPKCWEMPYGMDVTGEQRARMLMKFYMDTGIKAIFDVSGGDLANEVLEYLDYRLIQERPKPFWGYSDLTTILNAIYARTGRPGYLYQIRNLIKEHGEVQQEAFYRFVMKEENLLYSPSWKFIQGSRMSGVVIGGNIRCFLKLSGTSYMPDFEGKLLFLESRGGGEAQIRSLSHQLRQMGAFERIQGLLLGTFTALEADCGIQAAAELAQNAAGRKDLPIAVTREVGHGSDSKCLIIGRKYTCSTTGQVWKELR